MMDVKYPGITIRIYHDVSLVYFKQVGYLYNAYFISRLDVISKYAYIIHL